MNSEGVKKSISIRDITVNPGFALGQSFIQNDGIQFNIKNHIKFSIKKPNQTNWTFISDTLKEIIDLPNTNNSEISFRIEIKDKDFNCLPPNNENKMSVLIPISYFYAIKTDGVTLENTSYHECTHSFEFQLKQFEGRNWLAIDFGTSAIVAVYGNGISDNNPMFNLQEIHKNIIEDKYEESNIEEFNTPFLSSTIVFIEGSVKNLFNENGLNSALNDAIILSPTIDHSRNNYKFISPYLKSLIGYSKLPDMFRNRIIEENSTAEIYVNQIIKAAYSTLFEKYVSPIIKKQRNAESNKIVVSVPNTFTSRHENILAGIIKNILPEIWEDYIRFVSESDVVACHYALNYSTLIERHCKLEKSVDRYCNNRTEDGDTVLVYDMGAGTLDLTLFRRIPIENNCFRLEILGKTGFTTAGNYLDTLLAEITYEQVENKSSDFNPVNNISSFFDVVFRYKLFIRNHLKLALGSNSINGFGDKVELPDHNSFLQPTNINLNEIKNSLLFKEYMNKITTQAVVYLKNNLCVDPEGIKIKTLITTGRGAQLDGLLDKLIEAIKENFGTVDEQFLLITPTEIEMKSIVAKGAIDYVCNIEGSNNQYRDSPIHARIGYLVVQPKGTTYEELLSPKHSETLSINHHVFKDINKVGYSFKRTLNLNNVSKIIIIQTYFYDKVKIISEYRKKNMVICLIHQACCLNLLKVGAQMGLTTEGWENSMSW
jgi:hypothetical protein